MVILIVVIVVVVVAVFVAVAVCCVFHVNLALTTKVKNSEIRCIFPV